MSMPLVSAYLYQSPLGQKGIRPPATVGRSVGEGAASGVFSQEPGERQAQETTGGQSKFSLPQNDRTMKKYSFPKPWMNTPYG